MGAHWLGVDSVGVSDDVVTGGPGNHYHWPAPPIVLRSHDVVHQLSEEN